MGGEIFNNVSINGFGANNKNNFSIEIFCFVNYGNPDLMQPKIIYCSAGGTGGADYYIQSYIKVAVRKYQ